MKRKIDLVDEDHESENEDSESSADESEDEDQELFQRYSILDSPRTVVMTRRNLIIWLIMCKCLHAWSSLILIDICISSLHAEKARGTTLKRLLFNKTIVDLSSKKWSIESRYLSNKCSQQNQTRDTVFKTLLKNKNYKNNKIII